MNDVFSSDYDLSSLCEVITKHFNFRLQVTPRFVNRYSQSVYEEMTSLLIRNNAEGINTFIDIGAHYGFYSVLVGRSNPECEIMIFEPIMENCEVIRRNLKLNNVQASIYQSAVSDKQGIESFQVSVVSDNSGFISNPDAEISKHVNVKVVTIDQYYDKIMDGPVMIKIDVEGNEFKTLMGMSKLITDCQDIQLVIEFAPYCLQANGTSPRRILDLLENMGFEIAFIPGFNYQVQQRVND